METNLENLTALVAEHRQGKKRGRYPEVVWTAISSLRKTHTVEEISKSSGIAETQIYRRISGRRRSLFREVKLSPPTPATKPIIIELRRSDGAELKLRIEAGRDELSGLVTSFLR